GNVGIGTTTPAYALTLGSGQLAVATGTLAAPSITFSDDPDSGFWRSADNVMRWTGGGSSGVIMDAASALFNSSNSNYWGLSFNGVGTTTPDILPVQTDTDTGIGSGSANTLSLIAGGSSRLFIDTGGNIGINTSTPSYGLDVVGTAQFSQPILVGTPTLNGHATTKSYVDSVLTGGTATGTLANLTVTGTTTLATTAGNVGIGTTTPASKLTVAGAVRSTTGGFIFPDASTQTTAFTGTIAASAVSSGIFGSGIGNYTFGSATLQPILFVDSSGEEVGVGTSTPSSKLNVAGTANAVQLIVNANATQSNSNPLVQLRKSDSSVLSSWHSDSAQNLFIGYLNGTNNNISGTGSEGLDNIFIGYRTGNGNTTGTRNTALGSEAFEYNSTGYFNTAMGSFASHYNTTGVNNSSFGYFANYQNQTGTTNSAF
ncbi:MAG: hypothetical protein Q8L21_03460, partial [Candidatus Komeilibacteria bacterium]|nr:hypothetical protein [Candidatus Komeilibacteria bacterium]